MKIIEKTCPNCGASIEFNKGDDKVKCEYCKKTYVIEEEKKDDKDLYEYNLKAVSSVSKVIIIISIVSFVIIGVTGIIGLLTIGGLAKGQLQEMSDANTNLKSLDDLDEKTKTEINNKSREILDNDAQVSSFMYEKKEQYKNLGMYFLEYDDGNTIYDVYKAKFVVRGEEKDIYVAVRYENVKVKNNSLFGIQEHNTDTSSDTFMLGFPTNEALYKTITLKTNYNKITATKGLYLEKAK